MLARSTRILSLSLLVLLGALFTSGQAFAGTTYDFNITLRTAAYNGMSQSNVGVTRVDPTKSLTIRLTHLGAELDRYTVGSPGARATFSSDFLVPGDQVEIYQPQLPPGPPGVPANETFTMPSFGLTSGTGATALTGNFPAGSFGAHIEYEDGCYADINREYQLIPAGGDFSIPLAAPIRAGSRTWTSVFNGVGDEVELRDRTSGETICLDVNAAPYKQPPGLPPAPNPYDISIEGLSSAIADIRVVAARAGAPYLDQTGPSMDTYSIQFATEPLPGDTVSIYRPAAAPTPSATFVLPNISGLFDPTNNMVAITSDAPLADAAAQMSNTYIGYGEYRSAGAVPAGRTMISFDGDVGSLFVRQINADAWVGVTAVNQAATMRFSRIATRGDLTPPAVSASLKKRFKLKQIAKSVKLPLTSSEAVSAKISIALPSTLPSKKQPTRKPGKKLRTVASRTFSLVPGSSKVKLSLTRAGRNAVKQLRAVGRRLKSVPITVKITATDAAGNVTTLVQTGKIGR